MSKGTLTVGVDGTNSMTRSAGRLLKSLQEALLSLALVWAHQQLPALILTQLQFLVLVLVLALC